MSGHHDVCSLDLAREMLLSSAPSDFLIVLPGHLLYAHGWSWAGALHHWPRQIQLSTARGKFLMVPLLNLEHMISNLTA